MTVYGKLINNKFIPAPCGEIEDLLSQGFIAFSDEDAQKHITKQLLKEQIDELDKKRIRAGFEPSVKDEETGQTWLEYYTAQIQALREEISSL